MGAIEGLAAATVGGFIGLGVMLLLIWWFDVRGGGSKESSDQPERSVDGIAREVWLKRVVRHARQLQMVDMIDHEDRSDEARRDRQSWCIGELYAALDEMPWPLIDEIDAEIKDGDIPDDEFWELVRKYTEEHGGPF